MSEEPLFKTASGEDPDEVRELETEGVGEETPASKLLEELGDDRCEFLTVSDTQCSCSVRGHGLKSEGAVALDEVRHCGKRASYESCPDRIVGGSMDTTKTSAMDSINAMRMIKKVKD